MAENDAPANQTPAEPWYKGADAAVVGEIERRGLTTLGPVEAFANVLKSHQEAEKFVGAPANEIVRWPKDGNDAANWAALRARLGVPTEAKDYDFSTLKAQDGTPLLSDTRADALRTAFHGANVSKEKAVEIAKSIITYDAEQAAKRAQETQARTAADMEVLKQTWGANFDFKRTQALNIAAAMFEKSGMTKEAAADAINKLEGQAGGARVLEMFSSFATMAREDSITGGAPANGGPGVMSYQEATATKAALMRDEAFVARWNKGDVEAVKQMSTLNALIVANQPEDQETVFRRQLAEQYGRR